MQAYPSNEERTAEYLAKFSREKTLQFLIPFPKPVVFDVGANVGGTIREFKGFWPEAKIHAFEPQEECWSDLEAAKNAFPEGDIVINPSAAGNAASEGALFFTHDISKGISGFHKINLRSLDSVRLKEIEEESADRLPEYEKALNHERVVPVLRLDDYLAHHDIARINLLKIDTQGYEPEVLEGFGARLRDVDVVLTELMFYDYYERSLSFSDIERFLIPAGLRLYDISHIAKNPMNGRTDWVDVIYVNKRLRGAK
ncbi:MAG: FkbM family methyltransferase [Terrimicrobiaceae bacterium]